MSRLALLLALISILLSARGILNFNRFSFTYIKNGGFPKSALPTSSGYLVANHSCNCHIFYTYYEAKTPVKNLSQTPIILWLQGGPGSSGMIGNLYELGPWRVEHDLSLNLNKGSWNRRYGVLYVDNPIGTGFSMAENDVDIPTDQNIVVLHLHTALIDFFNRNPEYSTRPFFIAGESYGGKYVPSFGYYLKQILKTKRQFNGAVNSVQKVKSSNVNVQIYSEDGSETDSKTNDASSLDEFPFRLDGVMIGNGFTDPRIQVQVHGDTCYQFGLISCDQKALVDKMAADVVALVDAEDWYAAHIARTDLVNWIQNVSGLATLLDVRRKVCYHCNKNGKEYLSIFLNTPQVKQALNADMNLTWVARSQRVVKAMMNDTMKSTKWMLDNLLNEQLPVLLYQGQYDAKDGVASSEEWMKTLDWVLKNDFLTAGRNLWRVEGQLAGYVRDLGNLRHVVLLDAGHEVPADVAVVSQEMVESWIENKLDGL